MARCHGPLTPSDALAAYIYIFALIVRRLAAAASPGSLATWRWWSDALAAACVAGLGGWRAPRGAGECGLLGNCGWIGCFSQPQCHRRYSSPFSSLLGHVFPPSSRTSLMRQPPTVAGGARRRRRRRPQPCSESRISLVLRPSIAVGTVLALGIARDILVK